VRVQKLKRLTVAAGGSGQISPEMDAMLDALARELVSNALSLGCSAARKRKSNILQPQDIAPCMHQMWYSLFYLDPFLERQSFSVGVHFHTWGL
jgi:Transcription initiation factor TFIID subunit A